ncbi:MAG: fructose-6-phosphate aldolase [Verrucomicrobia bacterium]|nr:fructose-6-phosphate aldolase [Verrucomicrobiota bacterium]
MQLFIDSSSPDEIRQACEWGLIDGVTTNPTLISKGGADMQATLRNVVEASPGVVLCQVIGSREVEPLKAQARWLHKFSAKIVVKLPPSPAGFRALRELKRESPDIKIAVTLVSSVSQAYLAGKFGADIVAIFNGPLELALDQEVDLVGPVKRIYANYGFKTKVLSCGRFPRAFGQFAEAGTDICTLRFEFMKLLFDHPYTEQRLNGFLADWKGAFGEKTWPGA